MGEGVRGWVLRRVESQISNGFVLVMVNVLDLRSCHVRFHTNG